jgi:hypothetical protein
MLLRRWKLAVLLFIRQSGFGQDNGLVAYWPFDSTSGTSVVEASKQTKDVIQGNFSFVSGVRGQGRNFDGFTTRITRDTFVDGVWNAPEIQDPVTFEAWIAPQAYPWNWNAIVEQRDRYFFGLDETGHIGLRVFIADHWRECVSATQVPLMEWSHIDSRDFRSQQWPYYLYRSAGGWSSENHWPFRPEAPLRAERD